MKLKSLREVLLKVINNIDAGNTNLEDYQIEELLNDIANMSTPKGRYSIYAACKYIKRSRASLSRYIKLGWIVPRSDQGSREKYFYKEDLDNLKEKLK